MADFLPAKERTKPMMMPCVICKQEKMCWIICDDCWKLIDQGIYVQCPICLCFIHKDEECNHENLKYRNIDYTNVGNGTENTSKNTKNQSNLNAECKDCGKPSNGMPYCKECWADRMNKGYCPKCLEGRIIRHEGPFGIFEACNQCSYKKNIFSTGL